MRTSYPVANLGGEPQFFLFVLVLGHWCSWFLHQINVIIINLIQQGQLYFKTGGWEISIIQCIMIFLLRLVHPMGWNSLNPNPLFSGWHAVNNGFGL